MNDTDSNREKIIDRYIRGKMDADERNAFEAQMHTQSALYDQVNKEKTIHLMLLEAGLADIRSMMHNDFSSRGRINKYKWIGLGCIGLLLVGLGIFFYGKYSAPDMDQPIASSPAKAQTSTETFIEKGTYGINTNRQEAKNLPAEDKNLTSNSSAVSGVWSSASVNSISNGTQAQEKQNGQERNIEVVNTPPLPQKEVSVSACAGFKPAYQVQVTPSLYGQRTGRIEVRSAESKLIYTLSRSPETSQGLFTDLEASTYKLYIHNQDGCIFEAGSVEVYSTHCMVLEGERFNRDIDGVYKLPILQENLLEIKIYDKKYTEVRTLPKGIWEWDGRTNLGQSVDTGLFKMVLTYANGETCTFNLTVF